MTIEKQITSSPFTGKYDENILVVKREKLFSKQVWHGIQEVNGTEWTKRVLANQEFHPRSLMETDETFKQIIPYLIFTHDNKIFLMQRKTKGSESRLQGKWTVGIGGHIRQEDIMHGEISDWAQREFHEEVDYTGNLTIKLVGVINDDSNDVGKVHIGFVYLLTGDSSNITIKDEFEAGYLWSLEECQEKYAYMESWAQIVFDWLKTDHSWHQ